MNKYGRASLTGLLVVCFGAYFASAQTEMAQIAGSVIDPSQAFVPGAVVTVSSESTKVTRAVTTNERGAYVVRGLLPGIYHLRVEARGFSTTTRRVELPVGGNLTLDFGPTGAATTGSPITTP
jgi:Carboxypeptidase regulatory-like domain